MNVVGYVTEFRILSNYRELTDLRDNMRCPLEIVSVKKKRNCTAMKLSRNHKRLNIGLH